MSKDNTTPPAWQNERATGARKLEARLDLDNPDIIHTGDPDDEPKLPYGLTEPVEDKLDDKARALRSAKRPSNPVSRQHGSR